MCYIQSTLAQITDTPNMKIIKPRPNESLGDFSARYLATRCNKDGSTMGSSSFITNQQLIKK